MIEGERASLSDSLWTATAAPVSRFAPLAGDLRADVAIIGAGFTGLSAALHLAEGGARVVVIDTHQPGWGASGRNGGQVNPGLKDGPAALRARFGDGIAARLIAMSGGAADLVFDLIDRHAIACDAVRNGWLRAGVTPAQAHDLHALAREWEGEGGGVDPLDRDAMARATGTDDYVGGVIDRRGGTLHPLNYALGLARAAVQAGAAIHGDTPATGLSRRGGLWRVDTAHGALTADKVLLATNAYSGPLHRDLSRSVVPVCSVQVATAPLSPNVAASILPAGAHVSDARRLLLYFRKDAAGRFIMGGRGSFREGPTLAQQARLRAVSERLFPQLRGTRWDHAWGGLVAVTPDHMPHLHELAPGLMAGLGYNGRGIAMATAMGREMAHWSLGRAAGDLSCPVTPVRPLPFAFARGAAVEFEILRQRLLDRFNL